MKKKFMALVVAGVMSAAMLAGCGGNAEAPAAGTEAASGELTFADLQSNYALLQDAYQQVEDLYMNDGIAQSDDIEALLAEAKDVIDQMGEITEDQLPSQADMKSINDSMVSLVDSLGKIVDGMEVVDNGEAEVEAEDDTEADVEADAEVEYTYDGGFFATDGDEQFMVAFFETSEGAEFAYVSDGSNEAFADYAIEEMETDDGTSFICVTVGGLQLGYFEDDSDGSVYLVNLADGSVFAAQELDEADAMQLIAEVQ